MRWIFGGVLHKLVWHRSLTLHFEHSDFDFKFAETFVIKKQLPDLTRLLLDTIFFKPFNKSMVIVHYIPGLFFC
jgi:hypothetical protein